MRRLLILILSVALAYNCARHENRMETIISLENQRGACDSLLSFLADAEPIIRARAAEAIGKLQDPSCRSYLEARLTDENHNVRREAAFALGQIGDSLAEAALTKRLNANERIDIKARIVEALGKIGTTESFPTFVQLFRHPKAELRGEAALAMGRMALREQNDRIATRELATLLQDGDAAVRWKAAWAFTRMAPNFSESPLLQVLNDPDARVRMFSVLAVGRTHSLRALEPVARLLTQDRNWRVRVNAARALGNYPLNLTANYLVLFEKNVHVRTAIIQAIGASAQKDSAGYATNNREHNLARHRLEQILAASDSLSRPSERGAALVSYAQLLGPDAVEKLLPFMDHKDSYVQVRAVQALSRSKARNVGAIFNREFPDAETPVQIAILSEMSAVEFDPGDRVFVTGLESDDPVIVSLSARGLANDSLEGRRYAGKISEASLRVMHKLDAETAQTIFDAMVVFADTSAISVLLRAAQSPQRFLSVSAREALAKLGHAVSPDSIESPESDRVFDYGDLAKLKRAKALIRTERGDITIALLSADAPLTALNFVRLAEKGFFDGLTFHRVVPNFVIQGGDPRGDGWGSPGYAIRSEFNKHPYRRGTVGMASAGKDTEGSQFFITHSPQPHLDGRYTVFGQVTSGMEVVDAIQPNDRIVQILIER